MPIAVAANVVPPRRRSAASSIRRWPEFAAVLRNLPDRRHGARQAGARGARRHHRIEPGSAIASAALFLGAVWIGLVAITLVLILDRLVPADRQPAFPVGSHLRPLLSIVGQKGFSSLPPDVAATIDRLKQAQRI
jgi:hypothetical protein